MCDTIIDKDEFYKEMIQVYPLEEVKNSMKDEAKDVWDDMDIKTKLITCIKLDKDGTIKKENDKYA